jgi:phosphatidylinositol kinase/protein kinase (PI-3  family)
MKTNVIEPPKSVLILEKKITEEKRIGKKKVESNETDQLKRRKRGDKRYSLNVYNDLQEVESKVVFFRKEMFEQHFAKFSNRVKKLLKLQYEELIVQRSKFRERLNKKIDPMMKATSKKAPVKSKGFGPWETLWVNKKETFQKESPYKDFPSYRIRQIIVKGGDDLRQEIIAQQVLRKLKTIFTNEGTSLKLQTYEIVVISSSSGIIGRQRAKIEFIQDSISVDGLKKKYIGHSLKEIYSYIFGSKFIEAQKNFVESLAAYSLVTYLMQVKDRYPQFIETQRQYSRLGHRTYRPYRFRVLLEQRAGRSLRLRELAFQAQPRLHGPHGRARLVSLPILQDTPNPRFHRPQEIRG